MAGSRIPLIVSIALNIFLAGAIAGGIAWFEARRSMPRASLQALGNQLPAPERDAFYKTLREARHQARQTILDGQQARRDAAALLRQPTLDAQALLAALERARTADAAMRAGLEQRIVEFAAASSPADRAILAEGLSRYIHAPPPPPKKSAQ
ncbi:periplasmic heavy metal sensor [Labrys sp. KNU-23]|uniref:periplasmic heavy metal sensor n=1 Tax=Labrys sp. KNU-23 TaxID=2789216 RepID=UPI0011EC8A99|nr:periplasmic heavy metal sensor [Labrys sp. KNU-23]QEN88433.1 periplasmic heavy metal sensor [Labrys sp. KNU-23]